MRHPLHWEAYILKIFAAKARQYGKRCRVGVFWDYCSLPQIRLDGVDDRTPAQKDQFLAGLGQVNTWYAHPLTTVLLVATKLPTGHEYTNLHPCECRRIQTHAPLAFSPSSDSDSDGFW